MSSKNTPLMFFVAVLSLGSLKPMSQQEQEKLNHDFLVFASHIAASGLNMQQDWQSKTNIDDLNTQNVNDICNFLIGCSNPYMKNFFLAHPKSDFIKVCNTIYERKCASLPDDNNVKTGVRHRHYEKGYLVD